MADMVNKNISELPFKDTIDDNTITHVFDGLDKNTTFSRVWEWVKSKISPTSNVTRGILVQDNEQNLKFINTNDFLRSTMGGLINSISTVSESALRNEGYTNLEIWIYQIARKSPFMPRNEVFTMYADQSTFSNFLNSRPARDYLRSHGIDFCDGASRVLDLRGFFIRYIDAGAGRDPGRSLGTTQEDAFQRFSLGVYGRIAKSGDGKSEGTQPWSLGENQTIGYMEAKGPLSDGYGEPRWSWETRPKNLSLIPFQKFTEIDWRSIKNKPPKLTTR